MISLFPFIALAEKNSDKQNNCAFFCFCFLHNYSVYHFLKETER